MKTIKKIKILFIAICLILSLTGCSNNKKNFGTGDNITKKQIKIEYTDVTVTDNDYFTLVLKEVNGKPGLYDYSGRIILDLYDKGNNTCTTFGYTLNKGGKSESKGEGNSPYKFTNNTFLWTEYINYQILYDEMDSDEIALPISLYFYKNYSASGTGFKGEYIIHLREDDPIEVVSEEYLD